MSYVMQLLSLEQHVYEKHSEQHRVMRKLLQRSAVESGPALRAHLSEATEPALSKA